MISNQGFQAEPKGTMVCEKSDRSQDNDCQVRLIYIYNVAVWIIEKQSLT